MTITDYLKRSDAQRILIVEVTRADGTVYHISDQPYITESVDAPASCQFSPIIAKGGIPRVRRALRDPLEGRASTSYGSINLVSTQATFVNVSGGQGLGDLSIFKGNAVTVKITAPRVLFPYDEAITLFTGIVQGTSGDHRGGMSIEVTDAVSLLDTTILKGLVIGDLTGPLAFGKPKNVAAYQTSAASLVYLVSDPAAGNVSTFGTVRDRGATVGTSDTDQAECEFTLSASPDGAVTADITMVDIILTTLVGNVLDRAGLTTGVLPRVFTDVPGYITGYFLGLNEKETAAEIITKVCKGAGCWWGVNRAGEFTVQPLPVPAAGTMIDETRLLDEVTFTTDDRIIRSIRAYYLKNWTVLTDPAFEVSSYYKTVGKILNAVATDTDESDADDTMDLETYVEALADAQTITAAIFTLYKNRRRLVNFKIPYDYPLLEPGSLCTITKPFEMNCYVLAVNDVFDGGYPYQEVEAIA